MLLSDHCQVRIIYFDQCVHVNSVVSIDFVRNMINSVVSIDFVRNMINSVASIDFVRNMINVIQNYKF